MECGISAYLASMGGHMRYILVGFSALTAAGCISGKLSTKVIAGIGDPCTDTSECRLPLECDATTSTCQPGHHVKEGDPCTVSADCEPTLYCARGTCAPAGDRGVGALCTSTGQCESELVCAFVGFGGTCSEGGEGDKGDRCATTEDCIPALFCDPFTHECQNDWSEPVGLVCDRDAQCAPEAGVKCLADAANPTVRLCGGLGPDGMPITPWTGAACPAQESADQPFRVLFEVPGPANEDFFSLPFPNDIRTLGGTVDLSGFPRPPLYSVPADLLTRYVQAIEAEQDGYGPNQTVFLRTSRLPDFCAAGCGATGTCAPGCMGAGEPGKSVYAVDLTDGNFVGYVWNASSGPQPYVCGTWIAVTPTFTSPWQPGHTYAVFLHQRIRAAAGSATQVIQAQDADFAAMLHATQPATAPLREAWTAYQPLRDWLATTPTYPTGDLDEGATIFSEHIGGAAVFTIRDPTRMMTALGDVIEGMSSFATSNLVKCEIPPTAESCWDASGSSFTVIQGEVELPIFQEGDAPYFESGGGIVTDGSGVPQVQPPEMVRFSLSVPGGDPPVGGGGWPVVIYAHGTGGSYQSHLSDGTAELFATSTPAAVVLGIDQVAHGPRRGESVAPPDVLFFNFINPQAAKGNVLQSAADQLSLIGAIGDIGTAIAALEGLSTFALDATKVVFVGHSQGATSGALAMARASTTAGVVLSGAGGGLLTSFDEKKVPYDLLTIMRAVLADYTLTTSWTNPALSLIQGYMEDADPINFGRHISGEPLTGSIQKHLLHVVGIGDNYTPNQASKNFARRAMPPSLGAGFHLKTGEGIYIDSRAEPFATPVATPPVQGNFATAGGDLTIAVTVHVPLEDNDGHFVMFDDAKAKERVQGFVEGCLDDDAAEPIVVE
ncbi:MAG: hypothetical protein A2289_05085 [Deltaproteobacteria bacterium RIFOXYA12_FULL_58_15]|nr:MAG: hypothetical protein A2289_05085 [Deltaproteobacteria bacterium RIFOXYA12_FULL_58_15]